MSKARASVIVLGAGVAGCAAAITLGRAGAHVRLIAPVRRRAPVIGETLPGAVKPLLRKLGVWDAFDAERFLPAWGTVAVWGGEKPLVHDAITDPNGPGWQIARDRFGALLRRAAAAAGAQVVAGTLAGADRRRATWQLLIENAASRETLTADFVIDATGRTGAFARMQGNRRVHLDGLVCRYARWPRSDAADRDARTWVEAVPNGWWYTAAVPSRQRVFAFLTDGDLLPAATAETGGFATLLGETQFVRRFAPEQAELTRPQTAVARTSRLRAPAGEAWLAVGDAALAFDPLAGQGMLTALLTGVRGAEAVLAGAAAYGQLLESLWAQFLRTRIASYAGESRWPRAEFWTRRSLEALAPPSAVAIRRA